MPRPRGKRFKLAAGLRVIRSEPQRLGELLNRLIQFALFGQRVAQALVRPGIVRV